VIPAEARGAWREVEARLRPYVARRVAPADVDDVVQETFVRVYRGLPNLTESERFGAWVYRIAASAIVDHARMRARHPLARTEPGPDGGDSPALEPGDDLEADLAECIALFVARLPSPYREAVTLTELQGMTQRDAAEMLGVSLSGMKSRVQRGRDRIRAMFDQCCDMSVDGRGHVTGCTPRDDNEIPDDCRDAAASWAKRVGERAPQRS
jgi:RNA polymerase sigma-70 factor (ECF subfamily)